MDQTMDGPRNCEWTVHMLLSKWGVALLFKFSSCLSALRASKCFQNTFELNAREADAARQLSEGFAEEREWDLIEVVVNWTIEGKGGFKDSQEIIVVQLMLGHGKLLGWSI
jgi:hypothetical protein